MQRIHSIMREDGRGEIKTRPYLKKIARNLGRWGGGISRTKQSN